MGKPGYAGTVGVGCRVELACRYVIGGLGGPAWMRAIRQHLQIHGRQIAPRPRVRQIHRAVPPHRAEEAALVCASVRTRCGRC